MGSTVHLPCSPDATWMKDGVAMEAGGRNILISTGGLVINNLTEADIGSYECEAEEARGGRAPRMVRTVFRLRRDPRIQSQQPVTSSSQQRSFSAHTGLPRSRDTVRDKSRDTERDRSRDTVRDTVRDRIETDEKYDTDLSYDVSGQYAGDQFVSGAVAEARRTVDRALNHTVSLLFENRRHTERTPAELLTIFRYPSSSERELARAGEIYLRWEIL